MTATAVRAPNRPNTDAVYSHARIRADWAHSVELRMRCDAQDHPEPSHRAYVTAKTQTNRELAEAGHGNGSVRSSSIDLSLRWGFSRRPRVGPISNRATDPEYRRRGIAGSLVHYVSRYGFDQTRRTHLGHGR